VMALAPVVAPLIGEQLAPPASQRSHWYENDVAYFQVPLFAVRLSAVRTFWPVATDAPSLMNGAVWLTGGGGMN